MAQSIVGGLFGVDPMQLMQQRQQQEEKVAFAQAQLDPMQAVQYGAIRTGQQLGNAFSGLMGVQDPQLQAAAEVKQLVSQFDTSSSVGLEGLFKELSARGNPLATQVGQQLLKVREKEAELGLIGARTTAALREKLGTPENQAEQVILNQLKAKYGEVEGSLMFNDMKQTQAVKRAKASAAGPTIIRDSGRISETVKSFQDTTKPYTQAVDATEDVLTQLKEAIKTNNPTAFSAARTKFARALGDSTLSRRDIEAAGGDPSLAGRIVDTTSTLFTGTPSIDTMRDLARATQLLQNAAKKKRDQITLQQRDIAEAEFKFKPEQLDRQFPLYNASESTATVKKNVIKIPD